MLGFWAILWINVLGVMGMKIASEFCVHISDAKEAGYSNWGRSNCRINRKTRFWFST